MEQLEDVRKFKDRIRIFLILYYFGAPINDPDRPEAVRIFRTETRIQKIDFLVRNPDYLAYELLLIAKENIDKQQEIKDIIIQIFDTEEPSLKRIEMEKFFFGAYEDIDDIIAFLNGIRFIDFSSKKSSDFKTVGKQYFILKAAEDRINGVLESLPIIQWYKNRCQLILKYFGDLTGTQLKVNQYRVDQYRETSYHQYIGSIEQIVKNEFYQLYNHTI